MTTAPSSLKPHATSNDLRIGVVSFLNAVPLIDGFDHLRGVQIQQSVPSLLIDQLLMKEVDVALCSSIDYQRSSERLTILSCGLLGCDGPTLTVRLYAQQPIAMLQHVHCDTDSHTSVALLRILLREMYDIDPEMIAYDAREHVAGNRPLDWPDAMLLIGDKVVTDSPPAVRYPHQLDLGAVWAEHTGLPFVFALWLARRDADPCAIARLDAALDRQRRYNGLHLEPLIHRQTRGMRWPRDLASSYLHHHIAYELTDLRMRGLECFFEKAERHGLIEHCRPLEFFDGDAGASLNRTAESEFGCAPGAAGTP